ncbi:hypothetical protein AX774_g260 [Zancudomyces culisetae]|uniref:CSC1/OSCA1-like 7TM region domain-containing protein n=1 Tax=Zancudomyces culisetae TaxID=1213189 RepID=A0A1R1PZ23_ZANCU|nr:hypothetical protein AX774_g260 [Zancudomyces culisetae]|eukprot:OMH86187.1 hypothetical protein AX774_g260 [Zancudomyces culisetae]
MPMTLISIINTNSQFWATYIVLKAISTAFAVIHPVSILKIYFHRYLRTLTPRELYDLTFPQEQQLAPIYAFYTWLFTLCMLYCVYSPLISIIGVILFYFGYAVYKYNFLYVNYCRQMNAPSMFILAINRMFFALIFSQIYITLAMYIRYGEFGMTRTPAFFTAPLPFITLIVRAIYSYVFSSKRYSMVSQPEASSLRIDPKTDQTRYLHPILSSSLLIPVVSSKFESLLPLVYSGKIQYFYGKSVNEDANMTENEPIKLSIMNHSHSYTQSNDNLLYSAYTPAADQNRYHHNLFANPFNDNVSEYAGSEPEFSSTYPPNQVHRNSPPLNCSPTHSNHNNGYYNNYNEHNADYNSTSYDNLSNTYQNLHNNDYNHHNNYYNNNDSTNRYNKSNAIHTSSTNGFNGYANNNNPYSEHAPSPYPNDYPKNYNQHN